MKKVCPVCGKEMVLHEEYMGFYLRYYVEWYWLCPSCQREEIADEPCEKDLA